MIPDPTPHFPKVGIEPGRKPLAARLAFYRVRQLAHRLQPYQVGKRPSFMQRASWQTLLYWQDLMDSVPQWPDPEAPKPRIRFEIDLREPVRV